MRIIVIDLMKKAKMDQHADFTESLENLPVGGSARITAILGGRNLHRRLLGLGLRVGSKVNVLHHRGRGVVVSSSGNRIALGGGVVEKLLVEPLSSAGEI
jgi:ferrous iron transport protein A